MKGCGDIYIAVSDKRAVSCNWYRRNCLKCVTGHYNTVTHTHICNVGKCSDCSKGGGCDRSGDFAHPPASSNGVAVLQGTDGPSYGATKMKHLLIVKWFELIWQPLLCGFKKQKSLTGQQNFCKYVDVITFVVVQCCAFERASFWLLDALRVTLVVSVVVCEDATDCGREGGANVG